MTYAEQIATYTPEYVAALRADRSIDWRERLSRLACIGVLDGLREYHGDDKLLEFDRLARERTARDWAGDGI